VTLSALLLASALLPIQQPYNFYEHGPYDPAVPRPEALLGYVPGQQHTTYREQDMVVHAIAKAAPRRVKVIEFGKSWERRPLRIAVISSERNMARLQEIRQTAQKIASGEAAAANLLEKQPAIVWINQTIHGNESASFETAMFTIYTLAASRNRSITDALENTVVIVNPAYNPDGHERFAVWNRAMAIGSDHKFAYERSEPSWVNGRSNHYRFDMNRDRVAF
jgi:hypothetical protein